MNGMDQITAGEKYIDSREVIARIDYLTDLRDDAENTAEEHNTELAELEKQLEAAETDEERDDIRESIENHGPKVEKVWSADGKREYWSSDDFGDDEEAELHSLTELQDQAEGYSDWIHGATLIHDDAFEEYAQELAEDIGAVGKDAPWPTGHIDWAAAADELKQDYTSVEFDGETYWIR